MGYIRGNISKYPSFRWAVLGAYMLTGIVSQLIWITFAPILPIASSVYNVSEADIGLLSAVFPLTYIIISLPVGYFIDSYGFRKSILIGIFMLAIFGLLRAFAPFFMLLLIFQLLAGLGQPFIMNSISKLVKNWFPDDEAGLATGLGSLSLYLGIIIGLAVTPFLTSYIGLRDMLLLYGLSSIIVLIIFYFIGRERETGTREREYVNIREFASVFKNRNIILLAILFFIGIGIFTAFITWIEPILRLHEISMETAGILGGLMIIGGIFGSIVIPAISDKYRTRKNPMLISVLVSIVSLYLLTKLYGEFVIGIDIFIFGFFFMSLLPIALELSAESVDRKYIGTANSILWLLSQVGALILIIVYEAIASLYTYDYSILFSVILLILSVLAILLLKEKR